jgi:hypothetical protein
MRCVAGDHRQSSSHVAPHSILEDEDLNRLVVSILGSHNRLYYNAYPTISLTSSREEGWMKLKIGEAGNWEQMHIVFDNGLLSYSAVKLHSDDAEKSNHIATKVHMDKVISLRTDVREFYYSVLTFYCSTRSSICVSD